MMNIFLFLSTYLVLAGLRFTFLGIPMECSKMAATWITISSSTEHHFILSKIGTDYTRYVTEKKKRIVQVLLSVLDHEKM